MTLFVTLRSAYISKFGIIVNMEKHILNYRIIIEPEQYDNGSTVYVAYCPTLDLSDYGDTIEKAQENMQEAIECHIEGLQKNHASVPKPDSKSYLVTNTEVTIKGSLALS